MTPLTREYLESRGFHESSSIETGYRSQFTACTEDYSFYFGFLSTTPLVEYLTKGTDGERFEVVIYGETTNRKWAQIPTKIIVSTVEQFETLLSMLEVELKLN